jgi:hypothetical protein
VLSLILGLAAVALAAAGVGKLVDHVTDGDGVAVLDHPVAPVCWACGGAGLVSPGAGLSEWSHTHPSGACLSRELTRGWPGPLPASGAHCRCWRR